jgi:hypothetical protein
MIPTFGRKEWKENKRKDERNSSGGEGKKSLTVYEYKEARKGEGRG